MSDQPEVSRQIIRNLEELIAEHAPPKADLDALANQFGRMLRGMCCWRCIQMGRIRPDTDAWEWQAITIVDGTALCAQHVLVKLRQGGEGLE